MAISPLVAIPSISFDYVSTGIFLALLHKPCWKAHSEILKKADCPSWIFDAAEWLNKFTFQGLNVAISTGFMLCYFLVIARSYRVIHKCEISLLIQIFFANYVLFSVKDNNNNSKFSNWIFYDKILAITYSVRNITLLLWRLQRCESLFYIWRS